jgi:hypothetical protein
MAIKGYGNIVAIDSTGKLWVDRLSAVEISVDADTREVDGYPFDNPDGLLQIVDAYIRRETYNVQISTGSFDRQTIARVFDQKITTESSVVLPHSELLTVGAGGVTTVTGLTLDQAVGVYLPNDTDPVQFTQITTGVPTAVQHIVTANTLTLNTSRTGQKVIVNYLKTYSAQQSIGVTNNPIGDLGLVGRLIGTRFAIAPLFYIPKISRFSGFSFGGESSEITYRAQIKAPFAKPIIFAFDVPLT